jgi:creatinine amidohydrolase
MTQEQVSGADTRNWICVLPVAATEQHGPHLPASTDCDIAEALTAAVIARLPDDLAVTFLPLQRIGASAEHGQTPGTISREPHVLAEDWFSVLADAAGQGVRRFVIVSSHGGNTATADMLILRARIELEVLAVATSWSRFGYPEGLFSEDELALGIHAGDVETSIMLAHNPELVTMAKAENFGSLQEELRSSMTHLRAYGPHRFGWMMRDLNQHGAVGNAAAAKAEKGNAVIRHQAEGFVELLRDVQRFDLTLLKR